MGSMKSRARPVVQTNDHWSSLYLRRDRRGRKTESDKRGGGVKVRSAACDQVQDHQDGGLFVKAPLAFLLGKGWPHGP